MNQGEKARQIGSYCRLFPVAGFCHTPEQLQQIIDAINNKAITTADPSFIPAGYTYLGQFIDHEITHMRHLTELPQMQILAPSMLKQARHGCFELDSLYGAGLNDPVVPFTVEGHFYSEFMHDALIYDLPRGVGNKGYEARVAEFHNDENFIVAQMQVLFMNIHNRLMQRYCSEFLDLEQRFQHVRNEVSLMLQGAVLFDFLPRFLDKQVYQCFFKEWLFNESSLLQPLLSSGAQSPSVPIEFAGAAFRFGHSLVRGSYPLNDDYQLPISLRGLFGLTGKGGLRSLETSMPGSDLAPYQIDWRYFFELDYPYFANALTLKPKLADQLRELINEQTGMQDLLWRNLMRGRELGLPSGQQCCAWLLENQPNYCEALGLQTLNSSQVTEHDLGVVLQQSGLAENIPLWLYVLMEPAFNDSEHSRLGKLGSLIVAETFRMLLSKSELSILKCGGSVSEGIVFKEQHPVCGVWLEEGLKSGAPFMSYLLNFIRERSG